MSTFTTSPVDLGLVPDDWGPGTNYFPDPDPFIDEADPDVRNSIYSSSFGVLVDAPITLPAEVTRLIWVWTGNVAFPDGLLTTVDVEAMFTVHGQDFRTAGDDLHLAVPMLSGHEDRTYYSDPIDATQFLPAYGLEPGDTYEIRPFGGFDANPGFGTWTLDYYIIGFPAPGVVVPVPDPVGTVIAPALDGELLDTNALYE